MTFDSKLPLGDLPGWTQVFAEPFDTALTEGEWEGSDYYPNKFRAYGPSNLAPTNASWRDSSKHGRYMPAIISVQDGYLREHVHTDPVSGKPFVAAIIPKRDDGSSSFMYGRFSVRARLAKMTNYKVAWLLWPDGGDNNRDGEIDFPEINLWTDLLRGFCHYTDQDATLPTQQGVYKNTPFDYTRWHVYTIEWTPHQVVFVLDGATVKTFTGDRIPHVPMHWVLQTETGIGVATPPPSVEGNVDIGWVAAWAYQP